MPATVVIDASEVSKFARDMGQRATRLRSTMGVVAELLASYVDDELETSGRGRFPPLAPSTLRQKARKGYPSKPLFATGAMAAANVPEHGDDYADVTNTTEYATFHVSQEGRGHVPLRDFFDIDPQAFNEASEIIVKAIMGSKA